MPFVGMDGPHFAKSLVTNFLNEDIPTRLMAYRNLWEVDDETLPDPQAFFSYEPEAMDTWPTIITVVINTPNFIRDDYSMDADPIYRVAYSVRTYVWVRSDGAEETTLMRDRLTTVVRSALLDHPALMSNAVNAQCELRVDETTLREEYSDITPLKGDRYIAGAYLSYTINLNEIVMRNPIAVLDQVNVEVELLTED